MLPPGWNLPTTIRARFGKQLGRQRAMFAEEHLLIILHRLPGPHSISREGVLFWRAPDGKWKSTGRGGGFALLSAHMESYEDVIHEQEANYESAAVSSDYFAILEHLVPVERAARNQLSALQSARESVGEQEIISLRDRAAEISRACEILLADARNGLEYAMARQAEIQAATSEEMAQASHRLNLIAAVFFPLTALGSMLGMNMHTGLESQPAWAFWVIFVAGLLLGGLLGRSLSGRRK